MFRIWIDFSVRNLMEHLEILILALPPSAPGFPHGIKLILIKTRPVFLMLLHFCVRLFGICKVSLFYGTVITHPLTLLITASTQTHGLGVLYSFTNQITNLIEQDNHSLANLFNQYQLKYSERNLQISADHVVDQNSQNSTVSNVVYENFLL